MLSALRMAHETWADMANKEPKASIYKSAPSTKSSSSYLPTAAGPSPRVARRAYSPKKSVETESVSGDFTTVAPPQKVISDEGAGSGIQSGSVTPVGGSTPSKPSGSATVTPLEDSHTRQRCCHTCLVRWPRIKHRVRHGRPQGHHAQEDLWAQVISQH